MKTFISLLTVVCGNRIRKTLHTIHTLLKSLIQKQGKSSTLKVEVVLPSLKVKSPTPAHKKTTTKFLHLPKCPVLLKTSYNEQIAKREAEKMSKRQLSKIRAYRCEFCPNWHLTHKKNKLAMH